MTEPKGVEGFAAYQAYLSFIHYAPLLKRYREDKDMKTKQDVLDDFKSLPELEKKKLILDLMGISSISEADLVKLLSIQRTEGGKRFTLPYIKGASLPVLMKCAINSIVSCSEIDTELFF